MPAGRQVLILVVDDDGDCREVTARLLEREGYLVRQAKTGQECVALVEHEPVDLVLLDVMMPQMDGFEVCAALRALPGKAGLPIILLTGKDDMSTRLEGMHHGVSEFLAKPISTHELYARVRAQLHIQTLTRQLETVERNLESRPGRKPPSASR